MSTGNLALDILLNEIREDIEGGNEDSLESIRRQFPSLSEKEARNVFSLVSGALQEADEEGTKVELVVTAPPSFGIKAHTTKFTVDNLIKNAKSSILITGYSLSDYFEDLVDCIVLKSHQGIPVKYFANDIESQKSADKLLLHKGKFLQVYNYPKKDDSMSALHAKVISVDGSKTFITSANLSYHGQEGNIEVGALIDSKQIAKQISDVFMKLVQSKVFLKIT